MLKADAVLLMMEQDGHNHFGLLSFLGWTLAVLIGVVVLAFIVIVIKTLWKGIIRDQSDLRAKRELYEKEANSDRDNTRRAWDLARVTLEQYFNRNLQQVSLIFYAAVGAMGAGFGLILWGAYLAIQHGDNHLPPLLAALSGIITEFLSVTLMVIYKSTLHQAATYMRILEKINTVGMAVQIVETIPASDAIYAQTRAAMAKMLLEQFKKVPAIPVSATQKED